MAYKTLFTLATLPVDHVIDIRTLVAAEREDLRRSDKVSFISFPTRKHSRVPFLSSLANVETAYSSVEREGKRSWVYLSLLTYES